jgi:8-oxo-dGTP pyrophosphatase MutT (NUDIX family)
MAPQPRYHPQRAEGILPRQSAVLLLLHGEERGVELFLTQRSQFVAHHKGQVSLPGGAREPQDDCLWVTALRETEEELGISLEGAELLGSLTPLLTGSSNYCIQPYIAYKERSGVLHPSPIEVDHVLSVMLDALLDLSQRRTEIWMLHGRPVKVPFFLLNAHTVWGATAMILSEFVAMLAAVINDHPA